MSLAEQASMSDQVMSSGGMLCSSARVRVSSCFRYIIKDGCKLSFCEGKTIAEDWGCLAGNGLERTCPFARENMGGYLSELIQKFRSEGKLTVPTHQEFFDSPATAL